MKNRFSLFYNVPRQLAVAILFLLSTVAHGQDIDSLSADLSMPRGYPVVLGKDTICKIYNGLGSFSAEERSIKSSQIIKEIAKDYLYNKDSLTIAHDGNLAEIFAKDKPVLFVTPADARIMGMGVDTLASIYRDKIQNAIQAYSRETSWKTISMQVLFSVGILAVSFFLIRFLNRFFKRRVVVYIKGKEAQWFRGVSIKNYKLIDSGHELKVVLWFVNALRILLIVLLLYITLPLVFSIFPTTESLAKTLFSWILSPVKAILHGIWASLPNIAMILVIWFAMRYILKGLKYLMGEIEAQRLVINGFYPDWAPATYNILKILLYAFTIVIIFPYIPGSDSAIFKGVSVFVGVVFSLGSSSVIANMIAGMVITYMRPFTIGDHIKIGEVTGDVLEKSAFATRVMTSKKEVVTIPNTTILSNNVTNYTTTAKEQSGVIFNTTITIGYDVAWRKVHTMLAEAAKRTAEIEADPAPYVLQTALNDYNVSYQLCAYTRFPEHQAAIYSELHQNIQDVFNENEVEILSPAYNAIRNGDALTIVRDPLK